MKAWILHDINDIRYEEIETPKLSENEVLVKVRTAGICGSDIPRIYRDGAHNMPLIPGHEFSGIVVETGSITDSSWKGKRAGIFPLIPCQKCESCLNKQYEMCKSYDYLGSRSNGAFAEYVAVPEWNLIELPDDVSFEQAAMLEPMSVAVHAMRRCLGDDRINVLSKNIDPKGKRDHIVVYGLGTIGLMLTMFLLDAGVEDVIVIGNKDLQKKTAISLGVKEENYCDSRSTSVREWVKEKTDGHGTDHIFECVGSNTVVSDAINLAAPSGHVMLVGNPHSDMALDKSTYWKILRNQLLVLGTWNSSFTHSADDDWHYVLGRLQAGRISLDMFVSHRYELSELGHGLNIMKDKSESYIKEMFVIQ